MKNLIQGIVNIFESGKFDGDYAALVVANDGIDGAPQISYGRSQLTESGGGLLRLLSLYDGKYAERLRALFKKPLGDEFKKLLVLAAGDEKMREAQDRIFDNLYWHPATIFCGREGLKTSLAQLLVYDSYIHSGKVPSYLRARFPDKTADELKWCRAYAQARRDWLANHTNPLLRKCVYRMDFMLHQMDNDNWMLTKFPLDVHGVRVVDYND